LFLVIGRTDAGDGAFPERFASQISLLRDLAR
jgi:hypothetical protein